jgi:hypothetical protein
MTAVDRTELLEAITSLKADFHRELSILTETINQRFDASSEAVHSALVAVKEATNNALVAVREATSKAEEAMNRRLEGMNEFREQLKDQAASFVSRTEMCAAIDVVANAGDVHHKAVDTRVDHLEQVVDTTAGKGQGLSMGWKGLIGSLGLIITILTIVILVMEFASK